MFPKMMPGGDDAMAAKQRILAEILALAKEAMKKDMLGVGKPSALSVSGEKAPDEGSPDEEAGETPEEAKMEGDDVGDGSASSAEEDDWVKQRLARMKR